MQSKEFIETIVDNVTEAIVKTLDKRFTDLENSVASLKSDFDSAQHKIAEKTQSLENTMSDETRKREEAEMKLEYSDQLSRQTSLRIFNLREMSKENTRTELIDLFNSKMGMKLKSEDIEICYRVGKQNNKHSRCTYLKLSNIAVKQNIYAKKKMLKGTGIVVKEDLTKKKVDLVNQIAEKIGFKNVWPENGKIYVFHNERTQLITSTNNLQELQNK
ncbi:unnamed protein product [Phaedon cochleariae]|uniref:Uncharacterized protein n=1 Tax=Phaedon cochleariae TaxID=80249 RepID=A0A9N9S8Z4_PHACE|nr:unnamed protein product [Phaedon cochleariae]